MSPRLSRALRRAAVSHRAQVRRGSDVPYVEHAVAVAWILDRLGFGEDVVIAGLLHDVVEDTEVTLDEVEAEFGAEVARVVADCSEVKRDAEGNERPWIDRKRDHLAALARAGVPARAVVLADKLHNLLSIEADLLDGKPIWSLFHAQREQVLWYYATTVDRLGSGDARLETLACQCREALSRLQSIAGAESPASPSPER